jgi:hypothetical protein
MKRTLLFFIAVMVALSTLVSAPQRSTAATAPLATFFPADTFAFATIDTSDLPATIETLTDILTKIDARIPPNWMELVEQQAAQQLGRPIDFETDVIGWIGDSAALGVYVPDETFKASILGRSAGTDLPKTLTAGLIEVKDEALADAFLALLRFTAQTEEVPPVNGTAVTIYADVSGSTRVARWEGYLAIGDVELVLDTLREKKATLDTDADYQKMAATLKDGTLASAFVRIPFSGSSAYVLVLGLLGPSIGNIFSNIVSGMQGTPTPTPSPTPQPSSDEETFANAALELGMGIHSARAESNHLILESRAWLNPDAVETMGQVLKIPSLATALLTEPKTIEGTLIDQVPDSAFAVLLGTDLKQIYDSTLGFMAAFTAAQELTGPRHKIDGDTLAMYKMQIEMGLSASSGLSLEGDLFSWMGGDFALYMTENKAGLLNTLSTGQIPADSTLLIAVTDAKKAQSAVVKINEALSKQSGGTPLEPNELGIYTLPMLQGDGLSFGIVDDVFLLTPASGVETATTASDSPLSEDATWGAASEMVPEDVSQVWYLNGAHLVSFLEAIDTSTNVYTAQQLADIKPMISAFDSALIYYRAAEDGISETVYMLNLK